MSAYEVNKLCRRALREPQLREALKRDPMAVLAQTRLTPEESEALVGGDVGLLYEGGASSFLLSYLPRWELFGLTLDLYNERMRDLASPDEEPPAAIRKP